MKSSDVNFAGESCRFVCENDEEVEKSYNEGFGDNHHVVMHS